MNLQAIMRDVARNMEMLSETVDLESRITRCLHQMMACHRLAEREPEKHHYWMATSRAYFMEMARLHKLRPVEKVREMEREQGLA